MGFSTATLAYLSLATAAAGTAVSVYASVEAGKQAKDSADYNARITENNAAYDEVAAMQQATKIRKAGQEQQAQAAAGQAASGVKLGEGSSIDIQRKIGDNTEEDAFNALASGKRAVASGADQSALLRTQGQNAVGNSYIGAGATILGSAAKVQSSWKTTAKTA